jgi:NAD(P)-dependent dehydrogenase (short-subunit alcohol dehydrogenase family)
MVDTTEVADSPPAVDLVVGDGSGMGAAGAREIRSDRLLLIADRCVEAAEAIAAPLGDGAVALGCDITDAGSVGRLAERTAHQVPRSDRRSVPHDGVRATDRRGEPRRHGPVSRRPKALDR